MRERHRQLRIPGAAHSRVGWEGLGHRGAIGAWSRPAAMQSSWHDAADGCGAKRQRPMRGPPSGRIQSIGFGQFWAHRSDGRKLRAKRRLLRPLGPLQQSYGYLAHGKHRLLHGCGKRSARLLQDFDALSTRRPKKKRAGRRLCFCPVLRARGDSLLGGSRAALDGRLCGPRRPVSAHPHELTRGCPAPLSLSAGCGAASSIVFDQALALSHNIARPRPQPRKLPAAIEEMDMIALKTALCALACASGLAASPQATPPLSKPSAAAPQSPSEYVPAVDIDKLGRAFQR